jgi:hypothetical protein
MRIETVEDVWNSEDRESVAVEGADEAKVLYKSTRVSDAMGELGGETYTLRVRRMITPVRNIFLLKGKF